MLEILCDVGRGLAALWVFAFHVRPLNTGLWGAAAVGDLGVPVFFVISGFCILSAAQNSRTKNQPALAFLKRRLLRIYPPFWASIVVVMCVPFVLSLLTLTKSHLWVPPNPRWYAYTWKDWILILSLCRVFCANGQPLSTAFNGLNAVYWSLAITTVL